MPRNWSDKDERRYKHLMNSAKAKGRSPDRAREIAARSVNKTRFSEARKMSSSGSATEDANRSLDDPDRWEF